MSCVHEVTSPQLDCLLDFALISVCCAEAWVAGLHWAVAQDHSQKESCCSHFSVCRASGMAILKEVGWFHLGDGATSIPTRTL